MKTKKIAGVTAAFALAMTLSAPTLAVAVGVESTEHNGLAPLEVPTEIEATVHAPGAQVISVSLPSRIPINIATKDDAGKHVIDKAATREVTAEVQNHSQAQTVDISVSQVSGVSSLQGLVTLALTPSTTQGTAGAAYTLADGTGLNVPLLTGLAGVADGATNPGIGKLALSASADAATDLTPLEDAPVSVTAMLKVTV